MDDEYANENMLDPDSSKRGHPQGQLPDEDQFAFEEMMKDEKFVKWMDANMKAVAEKRGNKAKESE